MEQGPSTILNLSMRIVRAYWDNMWYVISIREFQLGPQSTSGYMIKVKIKYEFFTSKRMCDIDEHIPSINWIYNLQSQEPRLVG